ncbi:MAG: NAD-dependent epimerase/dehydratase family protein [Acidobacteria bacterium]|nr:NAD-dependent epimerase/dehydratase family protein [Acidobacteriota bacterium]
MQRRTFLGSSAVAAVAGASTAAAQSSSGAAGAIRRVLITSAEHRLAQVLADSLAETHEVRLTGLNPVESKHPFQQSDLGHEDPTDKLVEGIDAIVHVGEPLPNHDMHRQIDHLTRRTYNLLLAAAKAGVQKVVYLSTLELLTPYDAKFVVDEQWRPRPSLAGPSLPKHLGEYTCREFARVGKLPIVTLRLGKVVPAGEMSRGAFDPLWVAEEDVAQAVRLAITKGSEDTGSSLSRWTVLHISSGYGKARFDSSRAKRVLGYEPAHNG